MRLMPFSGTPFPCMCLSPTLPFACMPFGHLRAQALDGGGDEATLAGGVTWGRGKVHWRCTGASPAEAAVTVRAQETAASR